MENGEIMESRSSENHNNTNLKGTCVFVWT